MDDSNYVITDQKIASAILTIGKLDLVGTADDMALDMALKEVKKDEESGLLGTGEGTAIVMEITDGETTTAASSKKKKEEINTLPNTYARAIKIGGPLCPDIPPTPEGREEHPDKQFRAIPPTGTFHNVWGDDGQDLPSIAKLKDVAITLLKKALEKPNS